MTISRTVLALACAALASPCYNSAHADFTYTETTQVTGGSLVSMMKMAGTFSKAARQYGQPTATTVIVKGNRMVRIHPESTEIIDLDAETMTQIDNLHHQYRVITFAEIRQQMEDATAHAKSQQAQQSKQPSQQQPASSDTNVKFDVKVRNTNATKDVAGLTAKEAIMTMTAESTQTSSQGSTQTGTLGFTNDLWLVPEIPGYKEVRDFYLRQAQKMGFIYGGTGDMTAMARQMPAGAMEGMGDLAKEMAKLKGVPALTVMRMGTTADGSPIPAASEAPLPADNTPSGGDIAKSALASSLPFGMGRRKAAPAPAADSGAANGPSVLLETTTQLSSFSSGPADASRFEIPAGYKKLEARN